MLAEIARGISSLLFPASCAGCRRPLESAPPVPVCEACLAAFPRCRFPGGGLRHLDGTVSPFLYQGACRELVLALKYQGRTSLVPFLADQMTEAVLQQLETADAARPERILPVPLHATRLRERGFNQAELLARALAERLEIPCETDLLIRCRATRPQTELTREERSRNTSGAFDLRSGARLEGARLLLVDDVLTTGATAEGCAALLKKAGARSVWAATAVRDL